MESELWLQRGSRGSDRDSTSGDASRPSRGRKAANDEARSERIEPAMAESTSRLQEDAAVGPEPTVGSQRYLDLFAQLSRLIGSHDAGEVAVRSCDLIAKLLEVGACSIATLSEDGTTLGIQAATHITPDQWSKIQMPVPGGIYERSIADGRSLLIRDREDFEKHFRRQPDARYASASCVVVPLVSQDRAVGVISVAHPLSRRWFEERDVELLEAVARVVGSALHSAAHYLQAVQLQKKLTDLFNSLHVGIIVVDQNRRVTQSNRLARSLFHIDQTDRPPLEKVLEGTVYNVCCRLLRQIEQPGREAAEDGLELKQDGVSRMFKIRAVRSVEAMLGEHLIMIEEVGQEEEVRRLRESENAKHSFLAIISHELRTPLTVIRGAIPLLASGANAPPPEMLAQIHRLLSNNCHRLTEVVNSILYVTEIESGTLKLAPRPIDIHCLLREIVERNATNAAQKRVRLVEDFVEDDPDVVVDGQRLSTVLSELVHNAIKFSHSDTDITVRTRREPPWFEIQVTNTGVGIDPCKREEIFKKFYQGNQTLTRTVGGCGLGLFLVYNIVRLHGGTVELLTSDADADETTFRVRLPLEQPGEAPGDAGRTGGECSA
jgi:signal transduction histidine kinase